MDYCVIEVSVPDRRRLYARTDHLTRMEIVPYWMLFLLWLDIVRLASKNPHLGRASYAKSTASLPPVQSLLERWMHSHSITSWPPFNRRSSTMLSIYSPSWHDSVDSPSVVASTPPGYCVLERARPRTGKAATNLKTNHGGICVFIKSELQVKVVDFPTYQSFELLTLFVRTRRQRARRRGRPSSSNRKFFTSRSLSVDCHQFLPERFKGPVV